MASSQSREKKGIHRKVDPKVDTKRSAANAKSPRDALQLQLTDDQRRLLQEMMHFTNQTTEEYVTHSVRSMLAADVDNYYKMGDPRREVGFKVLKTHLK
jgi:hypothetical protein